MTIAEEFEQNAQHGFTTLRLMLDYNSTKNTLTVSRSGYEQCYSVPDRISDDYPRLPDWFLAGVWDEAAPLDLRPDFRPDTQMTNGDGSWFRTTEEGYVRFASTDGQLRQKIVYKGNKLFVYAPDNTLLEIIDHLPTQSIYHWGMLFQERGWFDDLPPIQSQNIQNYKRPC